MELELDTLSNGYWDVKVELKEKRVAQSEELKALRKELTNSNDQLLYISRDVLKEVNFHNVLHLLNSLVSDLWDFHYSFTLSNHDFSQPTCSMY